MSWTRPWRFFFDTEYLLIAFLYFALWLLVLGLVLLVCAVRELFFRQQRSWRQWLRNSGVGMLAGTIVIFGISAVKSTANRFRSPVAHFRALTQKELPATLHDLKTEYCPLITEINEYYSFRCEPAETERLIRELQLSPLSASEMYCGHTLSPSWPNPLAWPGVQGYYRPPFADYRNSWGKLEGALYYYYLYTDAPRERVFIHLFLFRE